MGIALDSDRQTYLILVVGFGLDAADAALEDVVPSHFEEVGDGFVFACRNVAEEVFFRLGCLALCGRIRSVLYHGHGVMVVAVIEIAFEAKERPDFELDEHFVAIVILATSKVCVSLKKSFLAFMVLYCF